VTHLATEAPAAIMNHYADVIEGGNVYNSGTSYAGVPGSRSNDPRLRVEGEGTITADGAGTTSYIADSTRDWPSDYWGPTDGSVVAHSRFFTVCTAATNAANVGAARRIESWDNTNKRLTASTVWPAATSSGDTFTVLQGFRRAPNGIDIEDEEGSGTGYDRLFRLDMLPGEPTEFYGKGMRSYRTTVNLRLRLLKYNRDRDIRDSVFENLRILRDALVDQTHIESSYVRALVPEDGDEEVLVDDKHKVVGRLGLRLYYRINTTFL